MVVNGQVIEEPGHHHMDDISDNDGIAAVLNDSGVEINHTVPELHGHKEAAAPQYLPDHAHGQSAFEVKIQHSHAPAHSHPVANSYPAPALPPHPYPVPVGHSHPAPAYYQAAHAHAYPPIFPVGIPRNAGKAELDYIRNIGQNFLDQTGKIETVTIP